MALGDLIVTLRGNVGKLNKDLDAAIVKVKEFGTKTGDILDRNKEQFRTAGIAATAFGTAIIAGLGAAVVTGANFEQSMAKVKAVTGATGESFQKLRKQAIKLGIETEFSAKQAANGIAILGRAGFETQEIMGALPGTLDLAAAGELTLTEAADITANSIRGFNEEASEATRVADVLAATASSSNTDVRMLGSAFSFVAPNAAAVGLSIEDTAAAIGALSDAGIQGTRAGTGLRQMLIQLASPTALAKERLAELGIEIFNSDGTMRDFFDIVGDLTDAQINLTDATDIFGSRAGTAALVLTNKGAPALREYSQALENSDGRAREMAETLLDTLGGSFKLLQSSIETFLISISGTGTGGLQGGLRKIIDTLIEVVNGLTAWTTAHPELTRVITVVVGVIGTLSIALGGILLILPSLVSGIAAVSAVWTALTAIIGVSVGVAGPIGLAIAAITGIGIAIGMWLTKSEEAINTSGELVASTRDQADQLVALADEYDALTAKGKLNREEQNRLRSVTRLLTDQIGMENVVYDENGEMVGINREAVEELIENKNILADSQLADVLETETAAAAALKDAQAELADVDNQLTAAQQNLLDRGDELQNVNVNNAGAVRFATQAEREAATQATILKQRKLQLIEKVEGLRTANIDARREVDLATSSVEDQQIAIEGSTEAIEDNTDAVVENTEKVKTSAERVREIKQGWQSLVDNSEALQWLVDMGLATDAEKQKLSDMNSALSNIDLPDFSEFEGVPEDFNLGGLLDLPAAIENEIAPAMEILQNETIIDGFKNSFNEVANDWGRTGTAMSNFGGVVANQMADAFRTGFADILKGEFVGIFSAFRSMAANIFSSFINMLTDMLTSRLLGQLMDTVGGILGGGGTAGAVAGAAGAGAAGAAGAGTGTGAAAGAGGASAATAGALAIPFVITGLVDLFGGFDFEKARREEAELDANPVVKFRKAQAAAIIDGLIDILRKRFLGGELTLPVASAQIRASFDILDRATPGILGVFEGFPDRTTFRDALLQRVSESLETGELKFGRGGIVTSPFRGMVTIGENEPEVFAPLSKLSEVIDNLGGSSGGMGKQVSINLNVQTLDVAAVSNELIDLTRNKIIPIIREESFNGTPVVNTNGIETT